MDFLQSYDRKPSEFTSLIRPAEAENKKPSLMFNVVLNRMSRNHGLPAHWESVQSLAWQFLKPHLPSRVQACGGCYAAAGLPTNTQFLEMDAAFFYARNNSQVEDLPEFEFSRNLIGNVNAQVVKSTKKKSMRLKSKMLFDDKDFCWYHQRYGAAAVKCREPCAIWTKTPKELKGKLNKAKVEFLKRRESDTS